MAPLSWQRPLVLLTAVSITTFGLYSCAARKSDKTASEVQGAEYVERYDTQVNPMAPYLGLYEAFGKVEMQGQGQQTDLHVRTRLRGMFGLRGGITNNIRVTTRLKIPNKEPAIAEYTISFKPFKDNGWDLTIWPILIKLPIVGEISAPLGSGHCARIEGGAALQCTVVIKAKSHEETFVFRRPGQVESRIVPRSADSKNAKTKLIENTLAVMNYTLVGREPGYTCFHKTQDFEVVSIIRSKTGDTIRSAAGDTWGNPPYTSDLDNETKSFVTTWKKFDVHPKLYLEMSETQNAEGYFPGRFGLDRQPVDCVKNF